MKSEKRPKSKSRPRIKKPSLEMLFYFVALLILAGFIAHKGIDTPEAWIFLAVTTRLVVKFSK
jgi:hypothetical protein